MKKQLCWLFACFAMLIALPAGAQADEFSINEEGVITSYTGNAAKVTVLGVIGGVSVKAIGENAFGQNTAITEVVLPEGLTHIMARGFFL